MFAIELTVNEPQVRELAAALGKLATQRLPQDIATVLNMTASGVVRELAGNKSQKKGIHSELLVSAADAKKAVSKTRATKMSLTAIVRVKKEARFPLKAFKPRELSRGGVSYKTSPKTGTKKISDAFIARASGHVAKRKGLNRYPIQWLRGASPWGAVAKRGLKPRMVKFGEARLHKEMTRRINYRNLKAKGVL